MENKKTSEKIKNDETIARIRKRLVDVDTVLENLDTNFPETNVAKLNQLRDLHAARWRVITILDSIDTFESVVLS